MCTTSGPSAASEGTTTFNDVAVRIGTTPGWFGKSTETASLRPCPVMVTVAPAAASAGVMPVSLVTWKICVEVAVPAGVVTLTVPDEKGTFGTWVSSPVGVTLVNDRAAKVPNLTTVVPRRFDPVTWTVSPPPPSTMLSDAIDGSGLNDGVVGFARGVFTVSAPVVASFGTMTFTDVAVGVPETGTAAWPWKSTLVAEARP